MPTVWCPACSRRLPDGVENQCPFCNHVGVARGGVLRENIFEAVRGILSFAVPLAAGFAAAPYAAIGGFFLLLTSHHPMVVCFAGAAVGTLIAPQHLVRAALLTCFGPTVVYATNGLYFTYQTGELLLFNMMEALLISTAAPAAVGALAGRFVNQRVAEFRGEFNGDQEENA